MALAVRGDVLGHETGVRTERLYRTSRLLAYLTGMEPHPDKAIVGRNAFALDAREHGDGDDGTMTPEMVGAPGSTSAHRPSSAGDGLEARYEALGYHLTPEELSRVGADFTALASRKKTVLDEDLLSLLHHGVMEDVPEHYRLAELEVRCGADVSEATVVVTSDFVFLSISWLPLWRVWRQSRWCGGSTRLRDECGTRRCPAGR